jgi:DNA-binding NtrC family response regulator
VRIREAVAARGVTLALGNAAISLFLGDHAPPARLAVPAVGSLMGSSRAMQEVYLLLQRAAPTSAPVLVMGESGTGKELAARAIHGASPRRDRPFEIVDCGGLPPALVENELFGHERGAFTHAFAQEEGAFQRADGGTLFLDEIGELPLEVQPKLLRALGEGAVRRIGGRAPIPVDVRVVAATNRDLRREVNAGRFRADLYFRLAVIEIRMPALRDRLEDLRELVPILIDGIVRERSLARRLAPDEALYTTLSTHRWPGNVRELRNYLEQILILDRGHPPVVDAGGAPGDADVGEAFGMPLRLAKDCFERAYVSRLLSATSGNVAEASRRAGVDRRTLFRTLRRFGMKARDEDEG